MTLRSHTFGAVRAACSFLYRIAGTPTSSRASACPTILWRELAGKASIATGPRPARRRTERHTPFVRTSWFQGGTRESRTVLCDHERRRDAGLRGVPAHEDAALLPTRLPQALQCGRNAISDRAPDRR